jgi:hypothetical protein
MANAKRKCKHCKEYVLAESGIKINAGFFCDFDHASKFGMYKAQEDKIKATKKKNSAQKKAFKLNDKPLRLKEAQKAFNAFIRIRDKDDPCISCGRHHEGQYHAGHFKTAGGFPELRFEELNCHKQCAPCNNHLSGNIGEYIPRLIDKIGQDKFDWINGPHKAKKYTCEDLKDIEVKYKKKLKAAE